ncbi:MAG: DoxX family protein [Acuticoccus sp.]
MSRGERAGQIERIAQPLAGVLTALALALVAGGAADLMPHLLPRANGEAVAFMVVFLAISALVALTAGRRGSVVSFLVGLFALLVGWRGAALAGAQGAMALCLAAFLAYGAAFVGHACSALASGTARPSHIQLGFIRLYLGLDLVPHFTEKLFAGPGPRGEDIAAFESLGVPMAPAFVVLAGLIELAAAIGVGLGLLTRLAAPATVLYLMIATVMGSHFALGFIWATPGGGWEYPVLWSVLILTFVFGGGGWLSLDAQIMRAGRAPRRLVRAMARPVTL